MAFCIPHKKTLTEEDIKWCKKALAEAEPYSDEELKELKLDAPVYEIDFARDKATVAKQMLERGWKY